MPPRNPARRASASPSLPYGQREVDASPLGQLTARVEHRPAARRDACSNPAPVPAPQRPHRSQAFTLIELLTVLAIVGVLIAILTPVVGKARASARDARCKSNLRQIGAAMTLYAHDNGGRLPSIGPSASLADPAAHYWQIKLQPYTGASLADNGSEISPEGMNPIFFCPEWEGIRTAENIPLSDFRFGYAMTASFSENAGVKTLEPSRRIALAEIRDPSVTLLVIESPELSFDPTTSAGGAYLAAPEPRGASRHGSTANYLFVDGHVSSKSPQAAKDCFPK